jgi:hypothetical protein
MQPGVPRASVGDLPGADSAALTRTWRAVRHASVCCPCKDRSDGPSDDESRGAHSAHGSQRGPASRTGALHRVLGHRVELRRAQPLATRADSHEVRRSWCSHTGPAAEAERAPLRSPCRPRLIGAGLRQVAPILPSPSCRTDGLVRAASELEELRRQIAVGAFPEVPDVSATVDEEDGVRAYPALQNVIDHESPAPEAPTTPKTCAARGNTVEPSTLTGVGEDEYAVTARRRTGEWPSPDWKPQHRSLVPCASSPSIEGGSNAPLGRATCPGRKRHPVQAAPGPSALSQGDERGGLLPAPRRRSSPPYSPAVGQPHGTATVAFGSKFAATVPGSRNSLRIEERSGGVDGRR